MKRILTVLTLLMSSAGAVPVDCSTPTVYNALGLTYSTKPGFPNRPERKQQWLPDLKAPLKICDLTFTADRAAQTITIEATSFTSLAYITSEFRSNTAMDFPLFENQVIGPIDRALTVNLKLPGLHDVDSVEAYINSAAYRDTVLGLRVDGGKLQPLLYNNSSPTVDLPPSVKTIDVYVQSKFKPSWERLSIDFKKRRITLYLKSPFPAK